MNRILYLVLLMLFVSSGLFAQDGTVSVPDVTGMNAPQAAAALNAAGLKLGIETNIAASEGQTQDTIIMQTPAPDARVDSGSSVDVQIARGPNIRLIYDNNDLTLINLSQQALALSPLVFQALEGGSGQFRGERWGGQLDAGECVQVWSIGRSESKSVADCARLRMWLTTNDTNQHVWTRASGVQRFSVIQDGNVMAECDAAPRGSQDSPSVCAFYVASPASSKILQYIYLAYTSDALVVRNPSEDGWLRLNVDIVPAAGAEFSMNDIAQYDTVDPLILTENAAGKVLLRQLAPNQCVRFRGQDVPQEVFPQPCVPFGDRAVQEPFWLADFVVRDREGLDHVCKAATPNRLTICVMPR